MVPRLLRSARVLESNFADREAREQRSARLDLRRVDDFGNWISNSYVLIVPPERYA